MPKFHQITPFMQVPDLEAALAWFGLMGFEPELQLDNYAHVTRGGVAIRVLESCEQDGAAFKPHRGFAYYVDVDDVDAVHAELAPKLQQANVEFVGPADQSCQQRELMIRAPDGNVFVFGASLRNGEV